MYKENITVRRSIFWGSKVSVFTRATITRYLGKMYIFKSMLYYYAHHSYIFCKCVATAGEVYSFRALLIHLGFSQCPCCLWCNIYSRFCYVCWLMILDFNWRRTVISFFMEHPFNLKGMGEGLWFYGEKHFWEIFFVSDMGRKHILLRYMRTKCYYIIIVYLHYPKIPQNTILYIFS